MSTASKFSRVLKRLKEEVILTIPLVMVTVGNSIRSKKNMSAEIDNIIQVSQWPYTYFLLPQVKLPIL